MGMKKDSVQAMMLLALAGYFDPTLNVSGQISYISAMPGILAHENRDLGTNLGLAKFLGAADKNLRNLAKN